MDVFDWMTANSMLRSASSGATTIKRVASTHISTFFCSSSAKRRAKLLVNSTDTTTINSETISINVPKRFSRDI